MRLLAQLMAFCFAGATLFGQPYINYRGVVNSASYAPKGVPAGSIARGSIFTIFGRNLGPAQFVTQPSFPLTSALAGVAIEVVQGNVTRAAIPIFVWNNQVSAVMPSDAPLGQVVLRLSFNGQRSNPAPVNVVTSSPGIFSLASSGSGPGVVQNFISQTDQPINTSRITARPGQTLLLWGTGLGPVAHPDNVAPTQVDLVAANTEIFVGGKLATRRYAGRSSCCAGLDLIVFDVPSDAPEGCFVPVQVRTQRAVVSNSVTIAIERQGRPCTDSFNPLGDALRAGGRIAVGVPARMTFALDELDATVANYTKDQFFGAIRQLPASPSYFDAASSLPPLGTCTTYSGPGSQNPGSLFPVLAGSALGTGAALQLTSPTAIRTLGPSPVWSNLLATLLGKQPGPTGSQPLVLNNPGTFGFSISGAGLGPLSANFDSIAPLQWQNRDLLAVIDRRAGLTFRWSGGNSATEVILVAGSAADDPSNSGMTFLCTAAVADGAFTVPEAILSTLPASPQNALRTPAWLHLSTARIPRPMQTAGPGLDALFLVPSSAAFRSAVVR